MKKFGFEGLKITLLWVLSVLVFIPLLIIFVNSFKTQEEAITMQLTLPKVWMFLNYRDVISTVNIIQAFKNSTITSFGTVLISVTGASLCAFVLSRRPSRLHKAVYMLFLIGLVAPLNMVPAILVLQKLHLMDSLLGLTLLYSALVTPFSIFLYYGFISSIPREVDEASIIDGCNGFSLFWKIVFPLLKPVTVTVLILNFMNSWNDFITPFYIMNSSAKMPLTTMVYSFFGIFQRSWHYVSVMMVLIVVPVIVVYALGQKYIISGMTAGAVKG